MKNKIFKVFSSSIRIKVTGRNVNNFIKRMIKNKINIVKLMPKSYKEVDIIINYNDLDKIKEYKTIYDIEIKEYYGKLKILKFLQKNVFLFASLIVSLIIIYALSNMIFTIEIVHSNKNIIKLLENELDSYGIKKYSFVKSYKEIERIENKILDENKNDLEWIEIIREGTKYIVRAQERIIKDKDTNGVINDIVASKNGVITKIIAENGEKVKNINTYVKMGEVVISSNITLPDNTKIQKNAKGKVYAEVWYTVDIEYPYFYNEVVYTGKRKNVLVFNFINKRISIFDFNKYKNFEKDTKVIFENNFAPISLVKEYQYETNVINDIYTYDEAVDKAIDLAKRKLLEKYEGISEIKKIVIIKEEELTSKVSLELFITVEEDITKYVEATIPDAMEE